MNVRSQDHPIFPLTVSGLGGAGNSFGGGGLDIEYEPTLTADDEIDGDEREKKIKFYRGDNILPF